MPQKIDNNQCISTVSEAFIARVEFEDWLLDWRDLRNSLLSWSWSEASGLGMGALVDMPHAADYFGKCV